MSADNTKGVRELRDIDVGEISLVDRPAIRREYLVIKRAATEEEMPAKATETEAKTQAPEEETEKAKAPEEETEKDAGTGAPVEQEPEEKQEGEMPEGEGEGEGEMPEGEGEEASEMDAAALAAAVEVGMPALLQWIEAMDDGDVKTALMTIAESVAQFVKGDGATEGETKQEEEMPAEEEGKAETQKAARRMTKTRFKRGVEALETLKALFEEFAEGEAPKPAPAPAKAETKKAADPSMAKALESVGKALEAITKSNEEISKRLDAIEKVRPVAKSEGGEPVVKGDTKPTADGLFGHMFGK